MLFIFNSTNTRASQPWHVHHFNTSLTDENLLSSLPEMGADHYPDVLFFSMPLFLQTKGQFFPAGGAVAKYQKGSCLLIAQYYKAAWLPHGHPQFAYCSTDLQSVLKAVALLSSFRLGIGLELQGKKKEIAHISEHWTIKKAAIWVPTNTTNISQFLRPFQTSKATELR